TPTGAPSAAPPRRSWGASRKVRGRTRWTSATTSRCPATCSSRSWRGRSWGRRRRSKYEGRSTKDERRQRPEPGAAPGGAVVLHTGEDGGPVLLTGGVASPASGHEAADVESRCC